MSVSAARERARRLVERDQRGWAASGSVEAAVARFELVLHPPTERAALADQGAAIEWVRSWREAAAVDPNVEVGWGARAWPSLGAQSVPERCVIAGADAIARFAGASTAQGWTLLRDRAVRVRAVFGDVAAPGAGAGADAAAEADARANALAAAIRANGRVLQQLPEADVATLLHVVAWLAEHPVSGRRVRELPIRGIDTKWLERHRGIVESLHSAVTGRESLGLRESVSLVRVRFLDPELRPGGLAEVSAPLDVFAAMPLAPRTVFVFENLETVLAMPEIEGAVVVHGSGYAVGRLSNIPWIRDGRIVYWGDLDSDGFAVLHALRTTCTNATSVLMDEETLLAYRDLWVPETRPAVGQYPALTYSERRALDRIRAEGGVRLEQERIEWKAALAALTSVAARH